MNKSDLFLYEELAFGFFLPGPLWISAKIELIWRCRKAVVSGGPGSGFIALPGGYGTFEELMEVVTWNQLGIHNRGIVVLNVDGYWEV